MGDRLKGKVAVVTGAANGIGQGCAQIFAAEGATVIGVDRAGVDESCDLLDEAAVGALFARIGDAHGRIDIIVNAAAFAIFEWIEAMDYADWKATLSGELDIVFLATRAAWPWLKASGRASVINFASANAHHALEGSPALAHCAGKGGVLAMTRQLAMEGAPHGIRANCISPGWIHVGTKEQNLPADGGSWTLPPSLFNRMGTTAEIASVAAFLASPDASFVTGQTLIVDGGLSIIDYTSLEVLRQRGAVLFSGKV